MGDERTFTERGQTFILPEYAVTADNVGQCRSCKQPILWVVTTGGKRAPIDPSGVNHFATCPQAGSWRRS